MTGLQAVVVEAQIYIKDKNTFPKPRNIIFYANNSAAIRKIFKGSQGKAQVHSSSFRRAVEEIMKELPESRIAISWCPGHCSIPGNETADETAKCQRTPYSDLF